MSDPPDSLLRSFPWFRPVDEDRTGASRVTLWVTLGIGLLIGSLLIAHGHVAIGSVACVLALLFVMASLLSAWSRAAMSRGFDRLGQLVGCTLGIVILVPLYLVVFSAANAWQRMAGSDPLRLRRADSESFWLASDRRQRKTRYVQAMFVTERLPHRGRRLLPAAVATIVLVVSAELTLRTIGFGDPVLYVNHPLIGYYPAPNQQVTRQGGRVMTNRFGMRSPDFSREKPPGVMRILLIGDSTLYGGSYIDQEALYSRLLERRLNKSPRRSKVAVLSIGVNAWGPYHKLGYVNQFGTFDADVAVVCMPIGDIDRPHYGLEKLPYFSVDRPARCAIEEIAVHLLWRYRSHIAGKCTAEARHEQGQRGIETYVRLAESLRDRGCEVIFEVLPSRTAGIAGQTSPEERRAVAQLRRALAAQGFGNFGYPVGLFQRQGTPEELYHDQCHLHRDGHRLYADYLKRRLLQDSGHVGDWAGEPLHAKRSETQREHLRR